MSSYLRRTAGGNTRLGSTRRQDHEPGRWRLSESQIRGILRAYDAGEMTVRDIAREYGLAERSVTRIARNHGRSSKINQPRNSSEKLAAAYVMWFDPNVSMQTIANYLGVHKKWALKVFRNAGYDPPNRRRLFPVPKPPRSNWVANRAAGAKERFLVRARQRAQGLSWQEIASGGPKTARQLCVHHSRMGKIHPEWLKELTNG